MTEVLVSLSTGGRTYTHGAISIIALASATCTIQARDRIAVMGRSGSGKSTLLHLLAGLDTPTTGSISWPALGARETLRPTKIGVVFQSQSLLPSLTVLENVEIPLLLGQMGIREARKAALSALERVELSSLAEKLPEEISGGQAQRVAVARALAYRPQLILADEPTGQLDQHNAQYLFDVLLASLEGTETALVVATHDMAIAQRMRTIWSIQHGILEGSRLC